VTNLLAQLGDYANVGQNIISVVDADSFWVDGYFEEVNLDGRAGGRCRRAGTFGQKDRLLATLEREKLIFTPNSA